MNIVDKNKKMVISGKYVTDTGYERLKFEKS